MKAHVITQCTLVGYQGPFPRKRGNCFSVEVDGSGDYRIVNFGAENLDELVRRGVLSWPVEIKPLSEREAVIADARIPAEWYSDYCPTCWPVSRRTQSVIDATLDTLSTTVDRAGELLRAAGVGEGDVL